MSLPRERAGKSKINGCAGYSAIVAAVAVGDEPRVEFRIHTRGLAERYIDFTPRQARQLIHSLEAALAAAEDLARHDGNAVASGVRAAPAGDEQDEHDASA